MHGGLFTCTQISSGSFTQRRESRIYKKKSPFRGVQNGLFRYRYSVPDTVWSHCAKLSLEANESAKSPSPSLAGQSVIVNQAGLLAPVHRSSASSQRFLPSDCWQSSTCGITPCYSGVTAPAYEINDSHTGFPMKHWGFDDVKTPALDPIQYEVL